MRLTLWGVTIVFLGLNPKLVLVLLKRIKSTIGFSKVIKSRRMIEKERPPVSTNDIPSGFEPTSKKDDSKAKRIKKTSPSGSCDVLVTFGYLHMV